MKAGPECLDCLRKLARQTIELATPDPVVRSKIEKEVERILERFSLNIVPPDLSNEFHRVIMDVSGNPDPYRERKLREIEAARVAFSKIKPRHDLRGCIAIAAQGNAIDFFVDPQTLACELTVPPNFGIDDVGKFERKLDGAREVLYLADNAGEVFFDMPLLALLGRKAKVRYVVKESAVQNDLTLGDLQLAGLRLPAEVIPSPATVGFYPDRAFQELGDGFSRVDVVVAKGMGNYETLSELPGGGKLFYLFRAKCGPVARSLGVRVGDYVAMLR